MTNESAPVFAAWAATPGVKIVTGNFNADGLTDLAAFGVGGWGSIRLAFSNGDGTFRETNLAVPDFPAWAATPGVQVVAENFGDASAITDLAAFGVGGWGSIPVAFSKGDGTFRVTNAAVDSFPAWAATPGVKVLPGTFQFTIG